MSTEAKFDGQYQIEDGYVGHRPKRFAVMASDLEDDMTDGDLEELYAQLAEDHFREHVTPYCERTEQFIEWAKAQIAARAKDTKTADLFQTEGGGE